MERVFRRIAENRILSAMEAGDFKNLKGMGEPFKFDEMNYDPNWWIKQKMEQENLKMSTAIPRSINSRSAE